MCRVFMCTAGTSGERICATSEMPLAQKRGSAAAPGMSLRNSGENSPDTVEMLTPTFSNTRPRISAMITAATARALPGGAFEPAGRALFRPLGREFVLDRLEFGADAVAQRGEPRGGTRRNGRGRWERRWAGSWRGNSSVCRNASTNAIAPASATLSDRAGGRKGITIRAAAAACTAGGTPALSRPSRIVSSAVEHEAMQRRRPGGRHQHQPRLGPRLSEERVPRGMPGDFDRASA